jgi:membrane protease YdiL (CAAX protease family)
MAHTDADPTAFEDGLLVPVAVYLVVVSVLSVLVFAVPGESPPPILGMAWAVFLVALVLGTFELEGASPRSILPSLRTLVPVLAVLAVFWVLYNLVAFSLALWGVVGFKATWSGVAAHPLAYLAALFSSLLFTAIPEELVFRTYLQRKFTAIDGGETRRAVVTGVAVVAVMFAIFHLPRWFLALGHGVGLALANHLLGLTLMGITYGIVYAVTGNLWLVAFIHATMNSPPVLVAMSVPPELHFVVGVVEYATIIAVVYLATRVTKPDDTAPAGVQREAAF